MDIKLLLEAQKTLGRRKSNKHVKKALGYIFITALLLVMSTLSTSVNAGNRQGSEVDPQKHLMSLVVNWYCGSIGFGCSSEN